MNVPPVRPAAGFDQPCRLEQPQGVLDGRPADAEHHGELAFRRKRLARLDQAKRDVPANLLGHVLVRAQLVDALESERSRPRIRWRGGPP